MQIGHFSADLVQYNIRNGDDREGTAKKEYNNCKA